MYHRKFGVNAMAVEVMGSITCGDLAVIVVEQPTSDDQPPKLVAMGVAEDRGFNSPYTKLVLDVCDGVEVEALPRLVEGENFLERTLEGAGIFRSEVLDSLGRKLEEVKDEAGKIRLYNRIFRINEEQKYDCSSLISWLERKLQQFAYNNEEGAR